MFKEQIKIEVVCVLTGYEDRENLADFIKSTLDEVIDGKVKSVEILEGMQDE